MKDPDFGIAIGALATADNADVDVDFVTIEITYTLPSFAITASSGANGSVAPSGMTNVVQGGSQAYAITPDLGYDIATLVVDSISIATSTSYTFTDVQVTHTIHATFVLLPYSTHDPHHHFKSWRKWNNQSTRRDHCRRRRFTNF